jgi:hypothetical protein
MQNVSITLSADGLEDVQNLKVNITVVATVNVDAKTARRKVTEWLVSEVGNMLIGGMPRLVISSQTIWRVPVTLTSSVRQRQDEVGAVDVNAESGDLLINDQLSEQIINNVQHFAGSTSIPVR